MTRVKIEFPLVKDSNDYPPYDTESVWAETTDDEHYKLDSIPFFARAATLGDVVQVTKQGGRLVFAGVIAAASCSLIRVVMLHGERTSEVRARLRELGCSTELFGSLIAVHVPGEADLRPVQAYLEPLEKREVIGYEEPILRHPEE